MDYPVESFTDSERAALAPHFTNLDSPVFGLVDLPETVKGALFARYSRYQGTLRRLYLDEFAADASGAARPFDGEEGERAAKLYERIFLGYGDDSVAQLGGAHVACEDTVSNVMTKLLQRGRLASYLEQSTRYIPYDAPMEDVGGYRYWRHEEVGPEYTRAMDLLFDTYSRTLPRVEAWAAERFPRGDGENEAAHARSIRPRRWTCSAACCPRRRCRTWARRDRPGVRADDPAAGGVAAARGARLRADDPERAEGDDAQLRVARGALGSRRRVGRLPGEAWPGGRPLGRPAGPGPQPRRRGRGRPVGAAVWPCRAPRTTACRAAVRVRGHPRAGGPRGRAGAAARRARADVSASWSASGATAAIVPAEASSRCATGSRWCPTTAPSATSSATGC